MTRLRKGLAFGVVTACAAGFLWGCTPQATPSSESQQGSSASTTQTQESEKKDEGGQQGIKQEPDVCTGNVDLR